MIPQDIIVILKNTYYGNTVQNYLVACGLFLATFIVLRS